MTESLRGGLWRNSRFVVLLSGQWVSRAGDVLFQMAVAWYVLSTTHSVAALGVVGGFGALARLFTLLAGVFVDRWDRLRTMIVTDIVRAALAFLAAGMAALGLLGVPALVAVVFVLAMAGTLFSPAEMALLPQVVEERDLAGANGANESASSLAQLLGMGLGGALIALLGPVLLFAANGISFIASVATLGWLRPSIARQPRQPRQRRERMPLGATVRGIAKDVAAGQRVLWTHPFLRRAIPIAIIVNFSLMPLNTLDVAWVRQVLHLGSFAYALFGIAIIGGILVGGVLAGRVTRRVPLRSTIVGGLLVAGVAVAALSLLPFLAVDLALLLLFGMAFGIVNVATSTAVQMAVPSELMGRIGGALIAASGLAVPLGAFLAGVGAALASIQVVFLATGALLLLGGALFVGVPDTMAPIAQGEAAG